MVPATAPWPLITDEGPRSSSTRSRLNVFCGRMTMVLGPSQRPSRRFETWLAVKPRMTNDEGAVGFSPETTPAMLDTASLTFR